MLQVDQEIFLSPPGLYDIDALSTLLNDHYIYERTLLVPYPYSRSDAEAFIAAVQDKAVKYGHDREWAIRNNMGELIGGFSLGSKYGLNSHVEEVGYWLSTHYRGLGIMPRVLRFMTDHLHFYLGTVRFEAPIYAFNTPSQSAAFKAGFEYEGLMRKAYLKNGIYIDAVLYAKVY